MMKEEFEALYGSEVPEKDYREIEYVYTHHPSIKNKQDIADIVKIGGMLIIRNMMETAELAESIEHEIDKSRRMNMIQKKRMNLLKTGYFGLENAIRDLYEGFKKSDRKEEFENVKQYVTDQYGADVVEEAMFVLQIK